MLGYLEKLHGHYEYQEEDNMLEFETDSGTDIQKNQEVTASSWQSLTYKTLGRALLVSSVDLNKNSNIAN